MSSAIHAQDANAGRIEVVVDSIQRAFSAPSRFDCVEVAVAYASSGGVGTLIARASLAASWGIARKRFLVSIDSGFTEPDALVRLGAIPNAEVRIPNAEAVLARSRLRPVRPFHPKAYLVRDSVDAGPAALLSGSANLTVSALTTGAEVVTLQTWSSAGRSGQSGYGSYIDWFEEAWVAAAPLRDVIDRYRLKRPAAQRGLLGPEDQDAAATAYSPPAGSGAVVDGALAARLASAKAFWIEAGRLSRNLGPSVPGNQLDAQRGARVFFSYPAAAVPRNHIFGEVLIRYAAGPYQLHSVRYGDNQMDKVNLPVPGADGPASYDGRILLFEKDTPTSSGVQRFTLSLISQRALTSSSRTRAGFVTAMRSGRRWGVLF